MSHSEPNAIYFVEGEHTLGLIMTDTKPSGENVWFTPIRAIVRFGATFRSIDSPYLALKLVLRIATVEDFKKFRVAVPCDFNPKAAEAFFMEKL